MKRTVFALLRVACFVRAAVAAGIGVLALAQSAEAKVVYTRANVMINGLAYNLDLNHDGIPDFTFVNSSSCDLTCHVGVEAFQRGPHNGIEARHFADALRMGAPIGPKQQFTSHSMGLIMASSTSGKTHGPWATVNDRFLGLKFVVNLPDSRMFGGHNFRVFAKN